MGIEIGTQHIINLEYSHDLVHKGTVWVGTKLITVPSNGYANIFIKAGTKEMHAMEISFESVGLWEIKSYRTPTITAEGTSFVITNKNAGSTVVRTGIINYGATFSDVGTLIKEERVGIPGTSAAAKANTVNSIETGVESILPPNGTTIIRVQNLTNAEQVLYAKSTWYEEDKEY